MSKNIIKIYSKLLINKVMGKSKVWKLLCSLESQIYHKMCLKLSGCLLQRHLWSFWPKMSFLSHANLFPMHKMILILICNPLLWILMLVFQYLMEFLVLNNLKNFIQIYLQIYQILTILILDYLNLYLNLLWKLYQLPHQIQLNG